VFIRNSQLTSNRYSNYGGIYLANTSAAVRVVIDSTSVDHNSNGVVVKSGPGLGHVKITNSQFVANVTDGIQVVGAGNDVLLSNVSILGSAKALDLVSGGAAKSYGNNVITNGDVPTKVPQS
jgi:hypothetical protein